jgi:hypothetical protein
MRVDWTIDGRLPAKFNLSRPCLPKTHTSLGDDAYSYRTVVDREQMKSFLPATTESLIINLTSGRRFTHICSSDVKFIDHFATVL